MVVTCLIGDPVEHSISPLMFGYFARNFGLEYAHVKLKIPSEKLGKTIGAIKVLGFKGANITLPHKLKVMKYLDKIDKVAMKIGAVNTILINDTGYTIGYNTDGKGALTAIETKLKKVEPGDRVTVFGAGGAARAIIYEIAQKTKHITVLNRVDDSCKAIKLQQDFKVEKINITFKELVQENIITSVSQSNYVINATSVGMHPDSKGNVLPGNILDKINLISPIADKLFFDAVFNPSQTQFLSTPRNKYGSKTCSGLYMMIYQGIEAFRIWTGYDVSNIDIESLFSLLEKAIISK